MRYTVAVLLLFIIHIHCGHSNVKKLLPIGDFTKIYADSFRRKYPDATFTITDDSTISAKINDNDIAINSDNAYASYRADIDSMPQIISRYLNSIGDLKKIGGAVSADRIVPVIKPGSFIDEIKLQAKSAGTDTFKNIYEKYNDQLIIDYAIDNNNSISYLSKDDLSKLSLSRDTLRKMAIRNLRSILPEVKINQSDDFYWMQAGGNYEVCLMLFDDLFTKQNFPVKGDIVIAIPNRDLMMITGSEEKNVINKIKKLAAEAYHTQPYSISDFLFRWNGKSFVKFDQLD